MVDDVRHYKKCFFLLYVFQKEDCQKTGLILRLQSLTYPNGVIESNFFTVNVKVIQLEVSLLDVNDVSVDAFNSSAFRTVKSLTFPTFALDLMRNGMFNGFDELETIEIKSANVKIIETGVLDSLRELKALTFVQSSTRNIELSLNGLTGAEPLQKLENVSFTYKLTGSINRNTFTGLPNVRILDLSSCQIEFIGENSFDSIGKSIKVLDLSSNKLITIASELFNAILPNDDLKIHIYGNSWNCSCELQSLKLTIELYRDNFDTSNSIECVTPSACRSPNILETTCFDDCDMPSTTLKPTTISTTTTTTTTTSPQNQNEHFSKQCYKPNESDSDDKVTVSIKRPIGAMKITETENGQVHLNIENEHDDLMVIWFDELQNSVDISDDDVNCVSTKEITSAPIPDFKENVIYTFCLMDATSSTVSPLDCMSYMKRREHEIDSFWLYESNKPITIALIVISSVVSVGFGIAIGFWIFKYKLFSKHGSQKSNGSLNQQDSSFNLKFDA